MAKNIKSLIKQYLRRGGVSCLFCGSTNIQDQPATTNIGTLKRRVRCLSCGGIWDDLYQLAGVDNVCSNERNPIIATRHDGSVEVLSQGCILLDYDELPHWPMSQCEEKLQQLDSVLVQFSKMSPDRREAIREFISALQLRISYLRQSTQ